MALAVFDEVAVIDPAVLVCLPHLPGFRAGLSVLAVAEHSATTFGNANVRRDLGVMGGTRRLPVWRKLPLDPHWSLSRELVGATRIEPT